MLWGKSDQARRRRLAFALKDQLDTTTGRVFYFFHDCQHFWKYVRPVRRVD